MFARDHKVWMTWRGLVALVLILALPSNIAFGGLTDATWVGPPDGAWSCRGPLGSCDRSKRQYVQRADRHRPRRIIVGSAERNLHGRELDG